MFLQNAWYVAATASELTDALLPRQIIGRPVVLYRDNDAGVVVLEDACAHRKLPLSMGRRVPDGIECGYHGMVYDCTGACVRIPGQTSVPPQARVRRYPAVERWGWVWVWMGAPEAADEALIMDVPRYETPGWTVNRGAPMDIDAEYRLVTDNLVDPTHVAYVHRATLGNPVAEGVPLEVTSDDRSVTASRWILDSQPAPFFRQFGNFTENVDRWQVYSLHLPSLSVIDMGSAPAGSGAPEGRRDNCIQLHSYNFVTPVDERRSRYYWFQVRNFAEGDETVTNDLTRAFTDTFLEDKVVLAAVQRGMTDPETPPINLSSDSANLKARRMLDRMIAAEAA